MSDNHVTPTQSLPRYIFRNDDIIRRRKSERGDIGLGRGGEERGGQDGRVDVDGWGEPESFLLRPLPLPLGDVCLFVRSSVRWFVIPLRPSFLLVLSSPPRMMRSARDGRGAGHADEKAHERLRRQRRRVNGYPSHCVIRVNVSLFLPLPFLF